MRLRMLVRALGRNQLVGEGVDIEVALAGAVDAIGPVQAGVEPLRAVGGNALRGKHVGKFIAEGEGVFFGGKIAALPAPIRPGTSQAVEHLAAIHFRTIALGFRQLGERSFVGDGAPQPGRHGVFFDLLEDLGDAGLSEVFLRDDIGRDLAPGRGDGDVFEFEDHRTVGVTNLARGRAELDARIAILIGLSETAFNAHAWSPNIAGTWPGQPKLRLLVLNLSDACPEPVGAEVLCPVPTALPELTSVPLPKDLSGGAWRSPPDRRKECADSKGASTRQITTPSAGSCSRNKT
jgi:hypothetical protein